MTTYRQIRETMLTSEQNRKFPIIIYIVYHLQSNGDIVCIEGAFTNDELAKAAIAEYARECNIPESSYAIAERELNTLKGRIR
jgi:hypothetical protein